MYRDASESLAQTIARLEGELRARRGTASPSRREQRLVAITGLSTVVAALAVAACAAAYTRAETFVRRHDERLTHLVVQNLELRRALTQCNGEVDEGQRALGRCEQAHDRSEDASQFCCFRLTECGADPL